MLHSLTVQFDAQLSDQLAFGPAESRILLRHDQDAVPAPAGTLLRLGIDPLRLVAAEITAKLT
jgi:hypothetical protein